MICRLSAILWQSGENAVLKVGSSFPMLRSGFAESP